MEERLWQVLFGILLGDIFYFESIHPKDTPLMVFESREQPPEPVPATGSCHGDSKIPGMKRVPTIFICLSLDSK